jgi:hypothetical protein
MSSRAIPYDTYPYQSRGFFAPSAPSAPSSKYQFVYAPLATYQQGRAHTVERRDVFGHRLPVEPSDNASSAGGPAHIASALASWNIPTHSWIHYYNGTYAWPAGLSIPDLRVSRLERSFVPTTAFLPQFTSSMATNPCRPRTNLFSSSQSFGRRQVRRAPGSHSFSHRGQYAAGPIPQPVSPLNPRTYGFDGSEDEGSSYVFTEEDMCPPPGFDDPISSDDKLTDLRAIVNFIVPAGGLRSPQLPEIHSWRRR